MIQRIPRLILVIVTVWLGCGQRAQAMQTKTLAYPVKQREAGEVAADLLRKAKDLYPDLKIAVVEDGKALAVTAPDHLHPKIQLLVEVLDRVPPRMNIQTVLAEVRGDALRGLGIAVPGAPAPPPQQAVSKLDVAALWGPIRAGDLESIRVLASPEIVAVSGKQAVLTLAARPTPYMKRVAPGRYALDYFQTGKLSASFKAEVVEGRIDLEMNWEGQIPGAREPLPDAPELKAGKPSPAHQTLHTRLLLESGKAALAGRLTPGRGQPSVSSSGAGNGTGVPPLSTPPPGRDVVVLVLATILE